LRGFEEPGPRGVQVDIITHRFEIIVATAVHEQRLVPAAEEMAELSVPAVEPAGIGAQQPFHAGDQRGLGRFEDQMKMVGHQAIGMDLPARFSAGFRQRLQKQVVTRLRSGDRCAPVPTVHHLIKRPRILDSQLARHVGQYATHAARRQEICQYH